MPQRHPDTRPLPLLRLVAATTLLFACNDGATGTSSAASTTAGATDTADESDTSASPTAQPTTAADPLASMRVSEAGFAGMARRARDVAELYAEGRLIAFLEGGYDPPALARSVAATLAVLDNADTATAPANFGADAPHNQGDAQE